MSTLDAKQGYFQIGIHEHDRDLMCFMTPWGRYRLKRVPMGLISSGDVNNQRCEIALVGLVNMSKNVDDILVYDTKYDKHSKHVWNVLQRCREHGITLNQLKFTFAELRVHYCGFTIDSDGYRVDDKKLEAISKFLRPSNVSYEFSYAFSYEFNVNVRQRQRQTFSYEFSSDRFLVWLTSYSNFQPK